MGNLKATGGQNSYITPVSSSLQARGCVSWVFFFFTLEFWLKWFDIVHVSCMTLRDSKHASAMLGWAEQAGNANNLVLAMPT